jgi:hypothetical protein
MTKTFVVINPMKIPNGTPNYRIVIHFVFDYLPYFSIQTGLKTTVKI